MKKNKFVFYSKITLWIAIFTPIISLYSGLSELIYKTFQVDNLSVSLEEYINILNILIRISLLLGAFVSSISILFGIMGYFKYKKDKDLSFSMYSLIIAIIIFVIFTFFHFDVKPFISDITNF